MTSAIAVLCATLSTACAVVLLDGFRRSGTRLLLWCAVGFGGLAVNSVLICVSALGGGGELLEWRAATAFAGLGTMLLGLLWEA